ncbi:medium-chain acyl-CoA ligase ACSF2, mitochondrial-like [Ylistrum balloti]|uniref:medium-chain acyl-CoA ligase ACSF2, mitochondrial-like n=1 Tax=Ylistrum balloti TaxID=509963 RepID=UPI002905A128|nr:medium-chain acyl-CoA ligase ACSF2, mitochondrial-like [Ylistrum balloti]
MNDLSYLSRPNTVSFRYKAITDVLWEKTDKAPEKENFIERFVGCGRRTLTNRELQNRSIVVAKYLTLIGIIPGDKVAIIGPNSIEWIIAQFAIFLTGAVAVQVNKTSESFAETIKLLKTLTCKVVLLDPDSDEQFLSDTKKYINNNEHKQDRLTIVLLQKSTLSSLPSLTDITLTDSEASISLPRIQPESSALIYTTSGSTGVPKLVEMTHMAVVNAPYNAFLGTGGDLTIGTCYNDCLFSWIGGSPIFNVLNGNARVFVKSAISLKKENIMAVWDIIMTEQCSNAIFFPHTVLDLIEKQDAILKLGHQLYAIATGGQTISSHLSEICGKLTQKLFVDYGSTEVGIVSLTELTPGMETGYVGPLFPGYEVKVIGESGETLNRGISGEILIRSPWMLKSYRNSAKLNHACFASGGWFPTGDIGVITTKSKLFVKGKSTEVIKRGGVKVLASVVETVIMKLPEVKEAVVLSVPDVRLFEEICACVVMVNNSNTTENELHRMCRMTLGDNMLGSAPSFFLRFNEFPRLHNGKTDKLFLKRLAIDRLKLT